MDSNIVETNEDISIFKYSNIKINLTNFQKTEILSKAKSEISIHY